MNLPAASGWGIKKSIININEIIMGFLKKSTVKYASKRSAKFFFDSIGPPTSDMMGTLETWMKDFEAQEGGNFNIQVRMFPSWDSALVALIWAVVLNELSTVSAINTDENFEHCYNSVYKEIERWIRKHVYLPEQQIDSQKDTPKPDTNIEDEMVDAVFSIVERTIIPCSKCSQKLRVPSNKTIRVKCPECGHVFIGTFQ